MLIKVTSHCAMGCNHCLENATPSGNHMSLDLFEKALEFTKRAECEILRMGVPLVMMLSGGECTDNPNIVEMVESIISKGWVVSLLTHGLWLDNQTLREQLLREEGIWGDLVFIQVTNDDRYYPRKPPQIKHKRIIYVDRLQVLSNLGRAASPKFDPKGLNPRAAPSSFNLRSLTHHHRSIATAIQVLRVRGMTGKSGFCTPSVCHDGTVVAGESRFCYPIGTIDSTNEELTQAILTMGSCNRCKQEEFLGPDHKRAIRISV
jgi:hypothetical protein